MHCCYVNLKLLKFDDEEGKHVFWHSTAHLMGEAMELAYGGCLCYGPPIESGFYYDMYLEGRQVSSNDFETLENIMKRGANEKQPFRPYGLCPIILCLLLNIHR